MDTVLNLGLDEAVAAAWAERTGDPRAAYDLYRRLLQMFGSVVLSLPRAHGPAGRGPGRPGADASLRLTDPHQDGTGAAGQELDADQVRSWRECMHLPIAGSHGPSC